MFPIRFSCVFAVSYTFPSILYSCTLYSPATAGSADESPSLSRNAASNRCSAYDDASLICSSHYRACTFRTLSNWKSASYRDDGAQSVIQSLQSPFPISQSRSSWWSRSPVQQVPPLIQPMITQPTAAPIIVMYPPTMQPMIGLPPLPVAMMPSQPVRQIPLTLSSRRRRSRSPHDQDIIVQQPPRAPLPTIYPPSQAQPPFVLPPQPMMGNRL